MYAMYNLLMLGLRKGGFQRNLGIVVVAAMSMSLEGVNKDPGEFRHCKSSFFFLRQHGFLFFF